MKSRLALPVLLLATVTAQAKLESLSETEMAAHTGQALFSMGYLGPSASGNPNNDVGFYKLGLQAQLDLNVNVAKLKLGCDTPTSSGTACDIDVDQVALTGMVPLPDKYGRGNADTGPASDFVLNNPFIELAIKSPANAAQRRMVGFRLGAESAWGYFSAGQPPRRADGTIDADNKSVMENPNNHTGVNSISGHLNIAVENAKIPTSICSILAGGANSDNSGCRIGGGVSVGDSTVNSDRPNRGDNRYDLNLKRANSVSLELKAEAVGGLLGINGTLQEDFRFIHLLTVGEDTNDNGRYDPGEGSPNFALSAQSENIQWRAGTTWRTAQAGWWLDLPPSTLRDFTTRRVYGTAAAAVSGLSLQNVNLNQVPVDNCFGSLKFC